MNNDSPLVSIIIPTYNRASLIMETIETVRRQTYTNWELIIVDDGSEDNTAELVSGLGDERIQFIRAGRIGVSGKIKNIGLAKARGELIAFLDSDDLWHPAKIEKQVKALAEFVDAGFCLTGGYTFVEKGKPVDIFYQQHQQPGIFHGNIFYSIFKSEINCYVQVLMFRQACLEICNGFGEEAEFSDVDFIIRLSRHFNAVVLYEPLFFRRLHDTNHSQSNWEKGYQQGIDALQKFRQDIPAGIFKQSLFNIYIKFGEKAISFKKKKLAIQNFLKAWKLNPFSIVPLKKIAKAVLHG